MNPILRKEFTLAALAGTIVMMGLGFIVPLFSIYIAEKGAKNFELGLIVSGFTFGQFLIQPFASGAGTVDPPGCGGAGGGSEKIHQVKTPFPYRSQ